MQAFLQEALKLSGHVVTVSLQTTFAHGSLLDEEEPCDDALEAVLFDDVLIIDFMFPEPLFCVSLSPTTVSVTELLSTMVDTFSESFSTVSEITFPVETQADTAKSIKRSHIHRPIIENEFSKYL